MLTHGSLFSGIGGFDLAAEKQGLKNIFSCEIEDYPHKVLKKNFPKVRHYRDIRDMNTLHDVDVLSAGFPCQDISVAGSGKGIVKNETRSGLFYEIIRLIGEAEKKPKYVILENVAVLRSRGLGIVLRELSRIGFNAEWSVIYAHNVGRDHNRARLWIIAYPHKIRCESTTFFQTILTQILQKKKAENEKNRSKIILSAKVALPTYKRRWHDEKHNKHLFWPNGVSKKLGKNRIKEIECYGNAIVVDIAECLFERLKQFDKEIKNLTK